MDEEAAGVVLIPNGVISRSEVEMADADPGLNIKGLKNTFLEREKQSFINLTDGHDVDMKR